MATDLKPGWSRWFCQRCRRPLENEGGREAKHADTVTASKAGDVFVHDRCGGAVLPSARDFRGGA